MENIGVLRQVTRETTNDPVVLFDPTDATRSISRGIAIDYYLKEPADKVVVDILDSAGQVVRSFSGIPAVPDQKPHGQAAESTEAEEEGGGKLAALQGIVESGDAGRPTRPTPSSGSWRTGWTGRSRRSTRSSATSCRPTTVC